MPRPRQCFISYAHTDAGVCDRIAAHLGAYAAAYNFSIWYDHRLRIGDKWSERLTKEINNSIIFVLLLSADFLNSEFIRSKEIPLISDLRNNKDALVAPIVISDCAWYIFCHDYIQAAPHDERGMIRPCRDWTDLEKAFAVATRAVGDAIADQFGLRPQSPFGPRSPT